MPTEHQRFLDTHALARMHTVYPTASGEQVTSSLILTCWFHQLLVNQAGNIHKWFSVVRFNWIAWRRGERESVYMYIVYTHTCTLIVYRYMY